MPRHQTAPTDDWQQLALHFTDPVQRVYELIRPIVLFGDSASDRSQVTATPERTLYRHVARFTADGMFGLQGHERPSRTLPHYLRHLIVELKAEHPPLRVHEIQTICYVRTGRRPDAKTVKRVLATAKLAILAASLLAGTAGLVMLRGLPRSTPAEATSTVAAVTPDGQA